MNNAINLTATPLTAGTGYIDLSWNGFVDPNWSHNELYFLISENEDANESSTFYATLNYAGTDGVTMYFPSGARVSFAMYSVMKDGTKTVQKISVVAP